MVQTVGGLKSYRGMSGVTIAEAVEHAFVLVRGWPDNAEVMEVLEELKPIAQHNASVYKEAGERLKELAQEETEARRLKDEADEAQAELAKARKEFADEQRVTVQSNSDAAARLEARADELDRRADVLRQVEARAPALVVALDDTKMAVSAFLKESAE